MTVEESRRLFLATIQLHVILILNEIKQYNQTDLNTAYGIYEHDSVLNQRVEQCHMHN